MKSAFSAKMFYTIWLSSARSPRCVSQRCDSSWIKGRSGLVKTAKSALTEFWFTLTRAIFPSQTLENWFEPTSDHFGRMAYFGLKTPYLGL